MSVGTINTSRWCIRLFCIGWLRNVQRFITRAELLYDSLDPLSSDVFARLSNFRKANHSTENLGNSGMKNQMERKLPGE